MFSFIGQRNKWAWIQTKQKPSVFKLRAMCFILKWTGLCQAGPGRTRTTSCVGITSVTLTQDVTTNHFICCSFFPRYLTCYSFFLEKLSPRFLVKSVGYCRGAEPAAVIGQQGHGVLASCSTVSPLLSRNASCLGSRPRNFFNISEASSEPPGRRMNFL